MKRVFLIGYMGSGKTTLGKAYSAATGLQFVDLDWYIEERMHKSISDLFAERGEDGFRLLDQPADAYTVWRTNIRTDSLTKE